MAGSMSIDEVKRTCKSLEVSPSKSARQSPLKAGGKTAAAKGAKKTAPFKGSPTHGPSSRR